MFLIHFKITNKSISEKMILKFKEASSKNYAKDNIVVLDSSKNNFTEVLLFLHHFFSENKVAVEDYVYLYNFERSHHGWFCEIIKKQGLKRIISIRKIKFYNQLN